MHLRGSIFDLDHTGGTDGHAGPATGAGISQQFRNEGAATAWPKPDGLGRAGIAAGLAIDIAEGETPLTDRHDVTEALCRGGSKDRLRTGLSTFAAKGAFPGGEIHARQTVRHGDDAGRTGLDAFCATAARGEVAQRDPGGTDAWSIFLPAAQEIAPAERDFHHHLALNGRAAPAGRK
ncbi:hypothetical protein AGR2A_pa60117 [Agrobacterium genomosp. 2 str. CFBP 5494]|uniref:Uncharacterized protein n=1 Tax=Agrobacterium genomosp. 2 str. CFBP 5494 TaxID=1183436 RepID=A0A9W5B792_9HYPH|nr:hypothetical protein AGR2A_pa60117 [Agrobacterium genomosp. 2 str. CFBP 5494]